MGVGVLGQHPAQRRLSDGAGAVRGEGGDVVGDVLAVAGDQHLRVGGEELLDPLPRIGDQAGGGAGGLEDPGGGGETDMRHRIARDVEHRKRVQLKALCWWV